MTTGLQPIIIKRKKVVAGDGHHGGAWKVAYADFVTAMMAFFLLMWLLNATTEEQRKGIADYFNPSIPIAAVSGGGSDALSGDSIFTENILAKDGMGTPPDLEKSAFKDSGDLELEHQIQALNAALKSDETGLSEHIQVRMSAEGLVIEITDQDEKPLFALGSADPSPILQDLLDIVAVTFSTIENDVKVVGHTDKFAFPENHKYTNWELSTARANTARRLLEYNGFPSLQIAEVSGKSSNTPVSDDPYAPQNRRISITILNT